MKSRRGRTLQRCELPQKICLVCGRPFSWRRKWEKCWPDVKYCSRRCRSQAKKLRD